MKVNKNPSAKDCRQFILLWAFGASLAGGFLFWRHHPGGAHIAWVAGAVVGCSGLAVPAFALRFYRAWMGLAAGVNSIVTRVLLALIYWGVLAPLALVFKGMGRDVLSLKKSKALSVSYWHDHDKIADVSSYRHLY